MRECKNFIFRNVESVYSSSNSNNETPTTYVQTFRRVFICVCACVCADRNPPPKIPRAWLTPLPQPLALLLLCWRCCIITEFRNSPALRRQLRCFAAVIAAVLLCFNYSYFNQFNLFCISLVFCCCVFFWRFLKLMFYLYFIFPLIHTLANRLAHTLAHTHSHAYTHARTCSGTIAKIPLATQAPRHRAQQVPSVDCFGALLLVFNVYGRKSEPEY